MINKLNIFIVIMHAITGDNGDNYECVTRVFVNAACAKHGYVLCIIRVGNACRWG